MPNVGQAGLLHPTYSSSLPHLVELTEAAAYADMFRAAPPELGLEAEVAESHTSLFAPRFDLLQFNRVIGLGVLVPATETLVALLIDRYRVAGVKNFGVQLSPEAQPGVLPRWLSRSEEHTSELQSLRHLVCRLLLEKKKTAEQRQ